ncbi:MAG: hypothetical protein IIC67_08235, partial [Thaumarchaeota archaeon]|nr:hypothetical protein [Nitrososphaerota archaeon]
FNTHPYYNNSGFSIEGDLSFTPFTEKFDEEVSGWEVTMTLASPNRHSFCGDPLDNIVGFNFFPDDCGCDEFSPVCDILTGCTAFIALQDAVDTLELSSGHTAFITGFTYDNANKFTITDSDSVDFTVVINIMSGLTINGSLSTTTLSATTINSTSLNASELVKTDANKNLVSTIGIVEVAISLDYFDALPERNLPSNWNGAFLPLATAQSLDSVPTNINVSKGTGKLVIIINAGSDFDGEILVSGNTIDRTTGALTLGDTDTITVTSLTTDNSTVDSNGNMCFIFTTAYITDKWFTGDVILSTSDLTLTDVDVYHIGFEQFNDKPNVVLDTFDVNLFTTATNAEFDAYLQTIHITGDTCSIDCEAELHLGADGETALVDKYWRLRKGDINEVITDGATGGLWVSVYYSNNPANIEDVTIKIWATQTVSVILT